MMMDGRMNYIIVVLLSNPPQKQLPLEMQNYISTYTYIDARKYTQNLQYIRKRIRFAMPALSLNQLKVGEIKGNCTHGTPEHDLTVKYGI